MYERDSGRCDRPCDMETALSLSLFQFFFVFSSSCLNQRRQHRVHHFNPSPHTYARTSAHTHLGNMLNGMGAILYVQVPLVQMAG